MGKGGVVVGTLGGRSRVLSEQEGGRLRRGYELPGRESEGDWRELEVEGGAGSRETGSRRHRGDG